MGVAAVHQSAPALKMPLELPRRARDGPPGSAFSVIRKLAKGGFRGPLRISGRVSCSLRAQLRLGRSRDTNSKFEDHSSDAWLTAWTAVR